MNQIARQSANKVPSVVDLAVIDELTEAKFNPLQFKDDYRERLLDRIRAKSQGKTITSEEPEEEKGGESRPSRQSDSSRPSASA